MSGTIEYGGVIREYGWAENVMTMPDKSMPDKSMFINYARNREPRLGLSILASSKLQVIFSRTT